MIVLAANALSAVASPMLVYPAGLGLSGSAIANVAAQAVGGAAVPASRIAPRARPGCARTATVMRAQVVRGRVI